MSFLKNILKNKQDNKAGTTAEQGLLIYNSVNDVIQAESILKKASFTDIRVVAPPPQYRRGCDLSIAFPIIERIGILRTLEQHNNPPETIIHVNEELMKPAEIFSIKDFGDYLMVRSANMKITVEKQSKKIVNISGGGCSDVPYLAQQMIGKSLAEAAAPRDIGYTLCAYTLEKAFEEARRQLL